MKGLKKTVIKKSRFILSILIFYFFSTAVNAGWTKVTESNNGEVFYVDMENIMERRDKVLFWELIDYKIKDKYGDLSAKIYVEGDCKNLKFKWLRLSYHKDAMGKDNVIDKKPSKFISDWQHPKQNSTSMTVLNFVCKNKGITL
tara:strand:- start:686 stop:1117 length:432 start_codon:yes stop_codon:yes gene_type:complete